MLAHVDGLWTALGELALPSDEDAKELRCVRLSLPDDASFDVYKAEQAQGPITLWRVRGFFSDAGADGEERSCVILGTKDGRALVNFTGPLLLVSGFEPTTRSLGDLSEVIAAAVRRFLPSTDDAN